MHRITVATLGLLALATLTVACSDDASTSDTVATSAVVPDTAGSDETVVEDTMVEDTMVDDTSGGSAPGDGTEFCDLNDDLNTRGDTAMSSSATPAEMEAFFEEEFPTTVAELAAVAPAEIADDLAVAVEGFNLLAERLAANAWDLTATFSDPALAEVLNDPKYSEASEALSAFCGD